MKKWQQRVLTIILIAAIAMCLAIVLTVLRIIQLHLGSIIFFASLIALIVACAIYMRENKKDEMPL